MQQMLLEERVMEQVDLVGQKLPGRSEREGAEQVDLVGQKQPGRSEREGAAIGNNALCHRENQLTATFKNREEGWRDRTV